MENRELINNPGLVMQGKSPLTKWDSNQESIKVKYVTVLPNPLKKLDDIKILRFSFAKDQPNPLIKQDDSNGAKVQQPTIEGVDSPEPKVINRIVKVVSGKQFKSIQKKENKRLERMDKQETKRKLKMVQSSIGNVREYNRNMNWRRDKTKILEDYSKRLRNDKVYLVTATCRFMSEEAAVWYMGRFQAKCPYVVVAEHTNKYHLHYIVNDPSNANYFYNGLKMADRFKEDFAVKIDECGSLEDTVSYLLKEVIRNETHIDFFSPAQCKRLSTGNDDSGTDTETRANTA